MKYISGIKIDCESRDSVFIKNGITSEELRNFPITLDLFDTSTKQTNQVAFQELEGNEFGQIKTSEGIYLTSVSDLLWNFLDCVDEPKELNWNQLGVDSATKMTEITYGVDMYTISPERIVYTVRTLVELSPIDSNCIFWRNFNSMSGGGRSRRIGMTNIYFEDVFNILQVYQLIMRYNIPLESRTEIYYSNGSNTYYRLFLNDKTIRFLTKLIALRR